VGSERAAFARVMVFANKAMCSRANLEAEASAWLRAAGPETPPGNGAEAALWGCGVPGGAEAVMTPVERASFEDKKLKMKRAMGVKDAAADAAAAAEAAAAAANPSDAAAQRRADTIRAMEAGDWSQVVDGQTREALGGGAAATSAAAPSSPYVVSPFSRAAVHRAMGGPADAPPPPPREMSVATVDAALNEVRPYLIADGGNVEVVSVERGIVALRLQGACGTCSSSAATMKMGIERALKTAFGDALKEVIQLGSATPGAAPTDAAMITAHLEVLAPAIKAYGGVVVVKRVTAGVVVVGFRGPAPLGQGIAAAVRDKFTDVREVLLEEP
jgi:Fe-S cluster biogenesis protein NfuA